MGKYTRKIKWHGSPALSFVLVICYQPLSEKEFWGSWIFRLPLYGHYFLLYDVLNFDVVRLLPMICIVITTLSVMFSIWRVTSYAPEWWSSAFLMKRIVSVLLFRIPTSLGSRVWPSFIQMILGLGLPWKERKDNFFFRL